MVLYFVSLNLTLCSINVELLIACKSVHVLSNLWALFFWWRATLTCDLFVLKKACNLLFADSHSNGLKCPFRITLYTIYLFWFFTFIASATMLVTMLLSFYWKSMKLVNTQLFHICISFEKTQRWTHMFFLGANSHMFPSVILSRVTFGWYWELNYRSNVSNWFLNWCPKT